VPEGTLAILVAHRDDADVGVTEDAGALVAVSPPR
jgi:hypothetical protein